jgi:predicted membrane-bound spermidine synthase
MQRRSAVVALCLIVFVASGFSGLVYESVWAQYLKLFLGHAAYAQTIVLVVFMGGMAIGAALTGRYVERLARPLVAYAAVELALGIAGLFFHDIYLRATAWGYDSLLPAVCSAEGSCAASATLAIVLLLPQSILLGTTFPLMVSGVLRLAGDDPGRKVAMLYFCNSIGAVVGVLASTFSLIPEVGLPGTSRIAGALNVAIAATIFVFGWGAVGAGHVSGRADKATGVGDDRGLVTLLLVVSALTGLSSFIYEIVWIRMLSLVLGSSTHAFELMLASFILGLALGGLWIRSRIDRIADTRAFLGNVQLLMGIAAIATLLFYNQAFDLAGLVVRSLKRTADTYPLYHAWSAALSVLVMLPATFLAGMTLPLITVLLLRTKIGERGVGFCYAANTLGAIVGVIVCVHVLLPFTGLRISLLVGGAIDVALGVVLLMRGASARMTRPSAAGRAIVAALVLFVTIAIGTSIDMNRTASGVYRDGNVRITQGFEVAFHRDGKTATVDVLRSEGYVAIKTNGKTDASVQTSPGSGPTFDEHTMIMSGTLPLAYRPNAKDVAIIGFGSGLTTATILDSQSVARVDTIEIEQSMVEGANAFRPTVEAAYGDPRSHIVIDDAKAHFARTRKLYDVIVAEPSNPWVSGVSSLFTSEFYGRIRKYLRDDGILVQWIQMYEFDTRLLASILQALGGEFDDFVVYRTKAYDLVIVASPKGRLGEPSDALFAHPGVAARLARIGVTSLSDLEARRVAGKRTLSPLLRAEQAPVNSDFYPYVDLNAPRARFASTSASEMAAIVDGPTPLVEMLEERPLALLKPVSSVDWPDSRQERMQIAARWSRYLTDAAEHKRVDYTDTLALPQWVATTQAVLVECTSPAVGDALWDEIVELASYVNPAVPAADAERMWDALSRSSCTKRLASRRLAWLDLFAAVGARDAPRMVATARSLESDTRNTPAERTYIANALSTGLLVQGDRAGARNALVRPDATADSDRSDAWIGLAKAWAEGPPDNGAPGS